MFNLLHGHIKDTAVFYIERLFFHHSNLKPYLLFCLWRDREWIRTQEDVIAIIKTNFKITFNTGFSWLLYLVGGPWAKGSPPWKNTHFFF